MALEPDAIHESSKQRASTKLAQAALRVQELGKSVAGVPILLNVNLEVTRGELIAVLGASGSGKTTLLRLICGFDRADDGTIQLAGRPVVDVGHRLHVVPERRGVGYVAQEGALFPHLNVRDNILFGVGHRSRRGSKKARIRHADELLELMELPLHYATRKPAALSGGEQQRVALARALAPGPTVVLLDEPFSALDAGLRADTRAAVVSSLKQVGATALLVTHDQDEALSMGDRVAVLQRGQLVQVDVPRVVYRHPVNAEVAHFVGDAVLVPGSLQGACVECRFGRLPVAAGQSGAEAGAPQQVDVLIRPEQFSLQAVPSLPARQNSVATVTRLDFYGHDARIELRADDGLEFLAAMTGIDLPETNQRVAVQVQGAVVIYPRTQTNTAQ